MILVPLHESITQSESDILKKERKNMFYCCSKLQGRPQLCTAEIWMWSCITWWCLCSSSTHWSTSVSQHKQKPAKLSYTWQLQSAVGWLNNSKFLHRTIWQAKDTSLPQIAFVKLVLGEPAGPLHKQTELLTSKMKYAASDWWLICEHIGNQGN